MPDSHISRLHRTGPQHGAAAPVHARRAARDPQARRREGAWAPSASSATCTAAWRRSPRTAPTRMFTPYVDRMDYVAAVSNGLGYCLAVEKLLNVEAPPRAAGGARDPHRAEPDRQPPAVARHARARHRRDHAGVLLPARARRGPEDLRELLRRAAHHARLPHRRPAVRDLRRVRAGRATHFCDMFLPKVDEYEELLTSNRIWVGPAARASAF